MSSGELSAAIMTIVIIAVVAVLSLTAGKYLAVRECGHFGAFQFNGTVYACTEADDDSN